MISSPSHPSPMTHRGPKMTMAMVAPWPRPRRPPSAYFLWLSAKREDIAKSLGTGKGPEVSKEVRTDGGRSLGTQMYRLYIYMYIRIYIYCIHNYIYIYTYEHAYSIKR